MPADRLPEQPETPAIAPPSYLRGGKRANLERCHHMTDWWAGYGKDEGCQFEGPWFDMVVLAAKILSDPATELVAPNLYRPDLADAMTDEQREHYTGGPQLEWPEDPHAD